VRARKPVNTQAGGPEGPHAPPAMERERIASRRHPKMTPTGKRKALGIQTGFRVPRHPFPVARQEIPVQLPNAKKLQNRRLPVLTLSALSHTVLSRQAIAPQRSWRAWRYWPQVQNCSQSGPWRRANRDRLNQRFSRAAPRPEARSSNAPEPAHAARRPQPRPVRSATGPLR
jgi:hypothetical protein